MAVLKEESAGTPKDIRTQVEPWGYDTAMIADGQVISGDNSGQMHDLAEYFRQEEEGNGQVNIFTFQKATVVEKYIPEQDARLVAAHFPEENWLITSVTSPFSIFLAAVCVAELLRSLFFFF